MLQFTVTKLDLVIFVFWAEVQKEKAFWVIHNDGSTFLFVDEEAVSIDP